MSNDSTSAKLQELFDLFQSDALTKEEYEFLKSKIINQSEEQAIKEKVQEKEPENVAIVDVVSLPQPDDLKNKTIVNTQSVIEPAINPKKKFNRKTALGILAAIIIVLSIVVIKMLPHESLGKEKNDLSELNLKGRVKSLSETRTFEIDPWGIENKNIFQMGFYIYNKKGNKIEERKFDAVNRTGNLTTIITSEYDGNDNKIEQNYSNAEGTFREVITYSYNDKGHVNEEHVKSSDGRINYTISYKYDDKGNLLKEYFVNPNGKLELKNTFTYKYDDNNNLVEKKHLNNFYKYDAKGNMIERYDDENKSNTSYSYDDKGRMLIESTSYDKTIFKYNKKGNLTEEISLNLDGSAEHKTLYKYDYDNMDNWIKETKYKDDIKILILERKIEYY